MKIRYYFLLLVCYVCTTVKQPACAQQINMIVNLSSVDGIEITPDNVFNFQIINNENRNRNIDVRGTLVYKNTGLRFSYTFNTTVYPGMNTFSQGKVISPVWNFSDNAFKDLFFEYRKMPQGTYEYCVEIALERVTSEEIQPDPIGECIYHTVSDIFLINLITPENDAKLYEYNPVLSWMVNTQFASALKYKLRLAELKEGQNNENAITRNNPVFTDNNLFSTSLVYPVTAKPLKAYQPYVWTVDAYYKGILLGGAEAWKFMIIEDTFMANSVPVSSSYLDINNEKRKDAVSAIGQLKLKYDLREIKTDTLFLELKKGDKTIELKKPYLLAKVGDNKYEIDFTDAPRLTHKRTYRLNMTNTKGQKFSITFKYLNPDLL